MRSINIYIAILIVCGAAFAMPDPYYHHQVDNKLVSPDRIAEFMSEENLILLYEDGVFDCSEIAGYYEWLLENNGVETDIVMSFEPPHMVVRCNTTEGWIAYETCSEDGIVYAIRNEDDYIYNSSNTIIYKSAFEALDKWGDLEPIDWWATNPELKFRLMPTLN